MMTKLLLFLIKKTLCEWVRGREIGKFAHVVQHGVPRANIVWFTGCTRLAWAYRSAGRLTADVCCYAVMFLLYTRSRQRRLLPCGECWLLWLKVGHIQCHTSYTGIYGIHTSCFTCMRPVRDHVKKQTHSLGWMKEALVCTGWRQGAVAVVLA